MAGILINGFESGDTSQITTLGTAQTVVAGGTAGGYVLQNTGAGATRSETTFASQGAATQSHVFGCIRFSVGSTTPTLNWLTDIHFRSGAGDCATLVIQRDSSGWFFSINNAAGGFVAFSYLAAPLATGFHFIEFDIQQGASVTNSMWLDGQLVGTDLGGSGGFGANAASNYGTTNIDAVQYGIVAGGAATASDVLQVDDITISDSARTGEAFVISRQFTATTPTYNAWTKSSGSTIDTVWNDTPFSAATNAETAIANAAQTGDLLSFAATQSGHGTGVIRSFDTVNGILGSLVAKTAATTGAGITQVGNILGTSSLNGVDITLTFSTAPIEGDVVYLWGGHTSTRPTPIGPSTSGYTLLGTVQTATTNTFGVWRKVMGATPDTTVVGQGTANASDSTGYGCIVLRQVDTSHPEDAVAVIAFANGSSTNPDPPSITTVTNNAFTIICASTVVSDSAWVSPANYGTVVASGSNDTNPYSIGGAFRSAAISPAAAENPAAFTSVTTGVWIAATIAIRPATAAGSAMSLRRRFGGADTDAAVTLTTSDVYYTTAVFADTWVNLQACEFGALHGSNSFRQTVEDAWIQVSFSLGQPYGWFSTMDKEFFPPILVAVPYQ